MYYVVYYSFKTDMSLQVLFHKTKINTNVEIILNIFHYVSFY